MRNKGTLIVCVSVILVFSIVFSGCFLQNKVVKQKPEELQEKDKFEGVITVWDFPKWSDSDENKFAWMESKIKEFEKKHPGVFIELRKLSWEDGPFELNAAVNLGTNPDIACVGGNINLSWYDKLEPLDQYLSSQDVEDFNDLALKTVTHNDKIWGIPFYMTTYVMFLNLDIFNEQSVSPPKDGIWTWSEFISKLKALTYDKNKDERNDIFGFHSFIKKGYYNLWGIVMADGAHILSDDFNSFTLHYQEGVSGLKKLSSLSNLHKVTPAEFGSQNAEQAWSAFADEHKIAVFPAGSWAVKALVQRQKKGEGFDFDVAYYPIGRLGMPNVIHPSVASYVLFKQQDEAKKEICIEFLKEITSTEEQRKLHLYSVFPTRKSVGNLYVDDPYMKKIQNALDYTTPPPGHPRWFEIEEVLQEEFRKVVMDKKSPEQALSDIKKEVDDILGPATGSID